MSARSYKVAGQTLRMSAPPMSRAAKMPKKNRAVTGDGSIGLVRLLGWWEEYRCGCVSETERYKKDLLGYCSKHGENRRYAYKDFEQPNAESSGAPKG